LVGGRHPHRLFHCHPDIVDIWTFYTRERNFDFIVLNAALAIVSVK